ncbi:helix-turn-helix domain-containing protein [Rheinheimera mesophila]|uniref:Helix-turn-helix domain-containing protein n=1 Tax=Rheinheimera mesophila TaxID=1547515 RepID=A0A3P3QMT1_9GAMM|nr:helix-turn-helix domain-containing protein [Rheinheimera mesophila]RRJ22511.1 helix-turn-helix domain-containing protein [Rheinheimera mesophila]
MINYEEFWLDVNQTKLKCKNNYLILDCWQNQLYIAGKYLRLNEIQKRLFACLLKNVTRRSDLFNYLWFDCPQQNPSNSYHQLLHQIRGLCRDNNLPCLLLTFPAYGVRLDIEAVESIAVRSETGGKVA